MDVIFGGGGFAREVAWLLHDLTVSSAQTWNPSAFVLAPNDPQLGKSIGAIETVDEESFLASLTDAGKVQAISNIRVVLAIGSPVIRQRVMQRLSGNSSFSFPSVIHPSAIYDKRPGAVAIGKGSIVCAGVVMTTNIVLEEFVHIDSAASLGHDCKLGSYSRVSPGVRLAGNVTLQQRVFVGAGATIIEGITIAADSVIGAGAVVTRDIDQPGTYVGVPARRLSSK